MLISAEDGVLKCHWTSRQLTVSPSSWKHQEKKGEEKPSDIKMSCELQFQLRQFIFLKVPRGEKMFSHSQLNSTRNMAMNLGKGCCHELDPASDIIWNDGHFFRRLPYCWWLKSGDHQLRLVVYPIIYRVSYIPGGAGFQPSTVGIHCVNICYGVFLGGFHLTVVCSQLTQLLCFSQHPRVPLGRLEPTQLGSPNNETEWVSKLHHIWHSWEKTWCWEHTSTTQEVLYTKNMILTV